MQTVEVKQTNYNSMRGMPRDDFRKNWNKVPRTPYKIFFETFVDPENFKLPKSHDGEITAGLLSEIPNLADLVSSKLMTPTFLKGMRIVADSATKTSITPGMVDRVVEVFDTLEPLPHTNNRIWTIHKSRAVAKLEAERPGLIGSLIYIREQPGAHNRIVMHFESLGTIERKPAYQRGNAKNEAYDLARLAGRIRAIKVNLTNWSSFLPEEKKLAFKEAVAIRQLAADFMPAPIDPEKKKVVALLDRSQGVTDRSGRVNPGAIWTLFHAAEAAIARRIIDISPKAEANQVDELGIIDFRSAHSTAFDLPEIRLNDGLGFIRNLRIFTIPTLEKDKTSPTLEKDRTRSDAKAFLNSLGISPEKFAGVQARPYLNFKNILEKKRDQFIEAALAHNLESGETILKEMRSVIKLLRFQEKVDKLNFNFTLGPKGLPIYKAELESLIPVWRELSDNFLKDHPELKEAFSKYGEHMASTAEYAGKLYDRHSQKLKSGQGIRPKEFTKFKDYTMVLNIEGKLRKIESFA